MFRLLTSAALFTMTLLTACATPRPEPGMEVIQHGHGEEMQVTSGVDWDRYTKVILYNPPVEFREHWKEDQERIHGRMIRDEDVERIKDAVAGQLARSMYTGLSERGGYEMTKESGAGTMVFEPNIVDLNVPSIGWVQSSIIESLPESRGSMTVELVIRDSVSKQVLGVAWQRQSDPLEGEMDQAANFSNSVAFRQMSNSWTRWLLEQLEKARTGN